MFDWMNKIIRIIVWLGVWKKKISWKSATSILFIHHFFYFPVIFQSLLLLLILHWEFYVAISWFRLMVLVCYCQIFLQSGLIFFKRGIRRTSKPKSTVLQKFSVIYYFTPFIPSTLRHLQLLLLFLLLFWSDRKILFNYINHRNAPNHFVLYF